MKVRYVQRPAKLSDKNEIVKPAIIKTLIRPTRALVYITSPSEKFNNVDPYADQDSTSTLEVDTDDSSEGADQSSDDINDDTADAASTTEDHDKPNDTENPDTPVQSAVESARNHTTLGSLRRGQRERKMTHKYGFIT